MKKKQNVQEKPIPEEGDTVVITVVHPRGEVSADVYIRPVRRMWKKKLKVDPLPIRKTKDRIEVDNLNHLKNDIWAYSMTAWEQRIMEVYEFASAVDVPVSRIQQRAEDGERVKNVDLSEYGLYDSEGNLKAVRVPGNLMWQLQPASENGK